MPLTSAVKVDGEPLYEKAHRGETVETPEREVMVYDLTLMDFDEQAQTARLVALTGKGTYVRQLVEDLGAATGAGGYAASLRRTRIGGFTVDRALSPEELAPDRYAAGAPGVLTLDEALAFLPRHEVSGREARLAANGNELTGAPIGRFRVYGPAGLLGVYEGRAGSCASAGGLSGTRLIMHIYSSLHEVEEAPERSRVVAIGVFDGVHRGHRLILDQTVERARQIGVLAAAVTFYPHPEGVLHPRAAPRMLTSLERKAALVEELGLDELVVVKFDLEFAQLSPAAFCRLVLSERLGARVVLVGENFRFGHRGAGGVGDLRDVRCRARFRGPRGAPRL